MWKLSLVALAIGLMSVTASAQDLEAGKKVFNKCKACHAVGDGAKNKVGPQLNGIIGAEAGKVEGFKYSKAMAESGVVWDEATLAQYLIKPRDLVKGTKMAFAGLKKEEDITNVIAYLNSYAADGTQQ